MKKTAAKTAAATKTTTAAAPVAPSRWRIEQPEGRGLIQAALLPEPGEHYRQSAIRLLTTAALLEQRTLADYPGARWLVYVDRMAGREGAVVIELSRDTTAERQMAVALLGSVCGGN